MMKSTVIQAGGQSSRMGTDKALLKLAGMPLIEHVLRQVLGLTDEILLTSNNPDSLHYLNLRIFSDPVPGQGALYGLRTALQAAQGNIVLILACDMPFIRRDLLKLLLEQAGCADVVIPEWKGNLEPLHAVYRRLTCLQAIEHALRSGEKRVAGFFPEVAVKVLGEEAVAELDPRGLSFFNVNTPADLAEAERIARGREHADSPPVNRLSYPYDTAGDAEAE
jgi:molybdopterin-guanine dinucleotide biosynthesis protein A